MGRYKQCEFQTKDDFSHISIHVKTNTSTSRNCKTCPEIYKRDTPLWFKVNKSNEPLKLLGYCDSDWANSNDRLSVVMDFS